MRWWACSMSCVAVAAFACEALAKQESADVSLDYVAKKAEQRARKPFHSPRADLPDILRAAKLGYDKYREIEFRHDKALWTERQLPFRVEFFHPGYLYDNPVPVYNLTLIPSHPSPLPPASFVLR